MQVWAVIYKPPLFTDDLYEKCLAFVDAESQARIKRFYHRVDACRTLIGRLLIRVLLKEQGMSPDEMAFAITNEGKPYIATQTMAPPLAYNITHDNNLVAMAFAPGVNNPPAYNVGIDVMKSKVPGRETFDSFVNTVGDQLTPLEHVLLKAAIPEVERLQRFFWMWTLKEAYTKALGIGLGFDFRRIEFDVVAKVVRVDGKEPGGWRFNMFVIKDGENFYQCVVAEYIGDMETVILHDVDKPEWLKFYDAVQFGETAIDVLKT